MNTDAERIAALEAKVDTLRDQLDWALLASLRLLNTMQRLVANGTLVKININSENDQQNIIISFPKVSSYVEAAIAETLGEQDIVKGAESS